MTTRLRPGLDQRTGNTEYHDYGTPSTYSSQLEQFGDTGTMTYLNSRASPASGDLVEMHKSRLSIAQSI